MLITGGIINQTTYQLRNKADRFYHNPGTLSSVNEGTPCLNLFCKHVFWHPLITLFSNATVTVVPDDDVIQRQDLAGIELYNPEYNSEASVLKYDIIAVNATSIDLPGEFGQSTLLIGSNRSMASIDIL